MPSEEEIEKIVSLWNEGKSYGEIANNLNGKKSTVQSWIEGLIKKGKIEPRTNGIRTNTKNATAARKTYTRERRLALNDMFYDKICEMTRDVKTTRDLKDLAISLGIIEDKRFLLEPIVSNTKGVAAIEKFNELLENGSQTAQSEATPEHTGSKGKA